jgi:hypothetical protein
MRTVGSQMNDQDLITNGVSSGSNLGRQNQNERLTLHRVGRRGGAMAEHSGGAKSGEVRVLGPRCTTFDGD